MSNIKKDSNGTYIEGDTSPIQHHLLKVIRLVGIMILNSMEKYLSLKIVEGTEDAGFGQKKE
ncbi:hypothetical protein [Moraxella catarrhalis]|uniref:hypothetical protein n=1 Tax=Moraxella catarrhalis TaxID=480 RepID=UPI002228838B|nr:hypothetical protein [Moraxella catarrhalis]